MLEEPDQFRMIRSERAGEQYMVFEAEFLDLRADGLAIGKVGAWAGQNEESGRMPLQDGGPLLEKPGLVFNRVDAASREEGWPADNLGKGLDGCGQMVFGVEFERHTVGLHDDWLGRVLAAEESGFAAVAGDDGIGPFENAPGAEQPAEDSSPFDPAFERLNEFLADCCWEIEDASMNSDDQRATAKPSQGEGDATEAIGRVSVDDVEMRFAKEHPEQVEGHEIAADGDELLALGRSESPDGKKTAELAGSMAALEQGIETGVAGAGSRRRRGRIELG